MLQAASAPHKVALEASTRTGGALAPTNAIVITKSLTGRLTPPTWKSAAVERVSWSQTAPTTLTSLLRPGVRKGEVTLPRVARWSKPSGAMTEQSAPAGRVVASPRRLTRRPRSETPSAHFEWILFDIPAYLLDSMYQRNAGDPTGSRWESPPETRPRGCPAASRAKPSEASRAPRTACPTSAGANALDRAYVDGIWRRTQ